MTLKKNLTPQINKMKLILILVIAVVLSSCKKDKEVCYQCHDANNIDMGTVCGEDEEDAYRKTPNIGTIENFRTLCIKK